MPTRFLSPFLSLCLLFIAVPQARASAVSQVASQGNDELYILTSIKPLELLVRPLLGERGRVESLMPGGASPHDYALRVSDMRRLHQADLVLWVGPELERFLGKALTGLSAEKQLELAGLESIEWPHDDEGMDKDGQHAVDSHQYERDSHQHERDPHLWLSPHNAQAIVEVLLETLVRLDPLGAEAYRARAALFQQQLKALDDELKSLLSPVSEVGFVVYHEGYSHWVSHFGLRQLAAVSVTPEHRPGARHLYQLRQLLSAQLPVEQSSEGQGGCLFAEPYYQISRVEQLAGELGLRMELLDPLGVGYGELDPAGSYVELMHRLGQSMSSCLQGSVATDTESL